MIHAMEKGRRLHVTIGDFDDGELFVVEPVNVETGAALLAHFLTVYTLPAMDPDASAEQQEAVATAYRIAETSTADMARVALGSDENFERAQTLRSAEFKDLVQCAFFWNVHGGGVEAMNAYLSGGLPKAVPVVFEAAGVQVRPLSTTSQSSESESPTP